MKTIEIGIMDFVMKPERFDILIRGMDTDQLDEVMEQLNEASEQAKNLTPNPSNAWLFKYSYADRANAITDAMFKVSIAQASCIEARIEARHEAIDDLMERAQKVMDEADAAVRMHQDCQQRLRELNKMLDQF